MNFIFDFDGTLLNTKTVMKEALNKALENFEVSIPKSDLDAYIINPLKLFEIEAIQKLSDKELSDFLENYRSEYLRGKQKHAKLFNNAQNILKTINDNGCHAFLISNSSSNDTTSKLKSLDINQYFTEVIGSDTLKTFKPHPFPIDYLIDKYQLERNDTYLVGDSANDIRMANAANIKSCAISSGINSIELLQIENPTLLLNKLEELLTLLYD